MNITYVNDEQEEAQKEWRFITGGGGFGTIVLVIIYLYT